MSRHSSLVIKEVELIDESRKVLVKEPRENTQGERVNEPKSRNDI